MKNTTLSGRNLSGFWFLCGVKMKNYSLVIRREIHYTEYADVTIKANSLEEAKDIAKEGAEFGEYEFDHDSEGYGEFIIEESE